MCSENRARTRWIHLRDNPKFTVCKRRIRDVQRGGDVVDAGMALVNCPECLWKMQERRQMAK